MTEKEYLPQCAAEAVRDLEILSNHPEHGDTFKNVSELIRKAAHIVLPMNGEIYRTKNEDFTKEECISSGVMPHAITTFEHAINDEYFAKNEGDAEINPIDVPDAMLTLVVDYKLFPDYDRTKYVKHEHDSDPSLGLRNPLALINLSRFGYGHYRYRSDIRWNLISAYATTLTPVYLRKINGKQCTELGLADIFTKNKLTDLNGKMIVEDYGVESEQLVAIYMSSLDTTLQACHALRVGATLESRKEKSYTRNRTFEKKGVGGFEYHVLKLPHGTVKETLGSRCGGSGADRDGPKYHFRRAHLRNLSTGTQTFVRSCFVGNRDKGVIEKEYKLDKEVAA